VCGDRFVLADATDRAKQEKDMADMTDASMMLGPIPIIWQFGTELCTSFRQGVVSMLESRTNPEVRRARLAAEEGSALPCPNPELTQVSPLQGHKTSGDVYVRAPSIPARS
jgi:hypothetical protein